MVLDKKGIFAEAVKTSEEVPFGKGKVLVTELGFNEVNTIRESPLIKNEKDEFDGFKFIGLLVVYSVRDAKGNRVFDDSDLEAVMAFPRSQYLKLADTAKKLNGMADDEPKNSEGATTGS